MFRATSHPAPSAALARVALRAAVSPLAIAVAAATLPADLRAQERRAEPGTFQWEGRVPAGRWVYLRNLNGDVRVEAGAGDRVEVRATKRWRRGNPDDVRVEARRAGDGESVIVCALWDEDDRCDEDGYRSGRRGGDWWDDRRGDVNVEFVVYVPRGVRVDMRTVNGGVDVRGAGAEVIARTTNGGVRAETSGGPVSAHTTNGSIDVRMRDFGAARDLDFTTTNGSVSVELPASIGAELEMSTVNGRVHTEFPITVSGRIDPKRIRATIGDGSRRVRLRTVNGNVELRRAS